MAIYPFTAIIGQEQLQLALLLNIINPAIGGVLIRGEKGTAKSTAVRGLTALLPEIEVVTGCRFSCDPTRPEDFCDNCRQVANIASSTRRISLVELPLGATEDMVIGGIDFSQAIQKGKAVLQPGLLARAHRSILYVDEVNLLDDHIVDLILDAAGSGKNIVEREGISYRHAARFIPVGTMNPEEGDLRPQLLDRFGLCIEVKGCEDIEQRVELLLRRESFDQDPHAFNKRYEADNDHLRQRIVHARKRLSSVRLAPHMRIFIAELCACNHVAGHRADLVMEQGARTLAAFEDMEQVNHNHIRRIAPMVLIHRIRDNEPAPPPPTEAVDNEDRADNPQGDDSENKQTEESPQPHIDEQQAAQGPRSEPPRDQQHHNAGGNGKGKEEHSPDDDNQIFPIGEPFKVKTISSRKDRVPRRGSGRRSRSRVSQKMGRYVRTANRNKNGWQIDIALDATIRAAAPFQQDRKTAAANTLAIQLKASDIRVKIRERRVGNLLLFVVDASGSMGARGRMTASKSAIMSLLLDAYQKRDKVGMISFRRNEALVNLPITNSVERAGKLLAEMPVGGRTPLSAALVKSTEFIRNYLSREPTGRPIIIIVTDGKTNVSLGDEKPVPEMVRLASAMALEERAKYIIVDTEDEGLVTFGLAGKLAFILGAEYFKTNDLQAKELVNIVREQQ